MISISTINTGGQQHRKQKDSHPFMGWLFYSAFFLIFLCGLIIPVPTTEVSSVVGGAFICLSIGIIGLRSQS